MREYEEIKISEVIANEVLIDREVEIGEYDWFVLNKKANPTELADIMEEHDNYYLLGYRK